MRIALARSLFAVGFCHLIFANDAHAYLDPASGSLIFQMVVAGIVGAAAALRIYWRRITSFFSRAEGHPPAESGRDLQAKSGPE